MGGKFGRLVTGRPWIRANRRWGTMARSVQSAVCGLRNTGRKRGVRREIVLGNLYDNEGLFLLYLGWYRALLSEVIEMNDSTGVGFPHHRASKKKRSLPAILSPFPLRRSSVDIVSVHRLPCHKRHGKCAGAGLNIWQNSSLTYHTIAWSFDSYSTTGRKSREEEKQ